MHDNIHTSGIRTICIYKKHENKKKLCVVLSSGGYEWLIWSYLIGLMVLFKYQKLALSTKFINLRGVFTKFEI